MKSRLAALALILAGATLTGCGDSGKGEGPVDPRTTRERPLIMTTFYPVTWMAERIAGELADVECPLPDSADPIFWKPAPEIVGRYQGADLIVRNGASLEKWVDRASLPASRIVDTARPFNDDFITYETTVTHSHGPAGEHSHEGLDGHTWVDPVNALAQAGEILKALVRILPAHEQQLQENHDALAADLRRLDEGFREATKAYDGRRIMASHPAYAYIARRYGWRVTSLDFDPDEMPSVTAITELKERLEEDAEPRRGHHLLWERAPRPEIAYKLRELFGLKSVEFAPGESLSAERRAAGEDFLKIMNRNLEAMRGVLSE